MKKKILSLIKIGIIATIIIFLILLINEYYRFFPSTEGKGCGGFIGVECSFGLECDYLWVGPDAPGVCKKPSEISNKSKKNENLNNNPQACTMEAKICPDGSSVGRSGPNCEFSPCPDRPSTEGEKCGGFAGVECSSGLECDWFDRSDIGICKKPSEIKNNP